MIRIISAYSILILLISCKTSSNDTKISEEVANHDGGIDWLDFEPEVFPKAKKEKKLVFLEVGANWCHWCHVMDDSTYSDEKVQNYLKDNFILTRADQDSRPDLYAAYKKWGWPAIIVFNEEGKELLKLKGYQYRTQFLADLKEVRLNPTELREKTNTNSEFELDEDGSKETFNLFNQLIDKERGAYSWTKKSLQIDGFKHGLKYPKNKILRDWTELTLLNSFNLVDPVWSGVYQYSAKNVWTEQHFEKILQVQANYIEAYALYGGANDNLEAIENAKGILSYCQEFLGNETPLFYNSQNADLISGVHSEEYYNLNEDDRLKLGTPSVDKHIYLKENSAMIVSIIKLWAATNEDQYLFKANEMFHYILENFENEKGLYLREKDSKDIISFEDNRQFLEVLMVFYQLSQHEEYIKRANELGLALIESFDSEDGLISSIGNLAIPAVVVPINNIDACLSFNRLGQITKNESFIVFAKSNFEKIDLKRYRKLEFTIPKILQAFDELNREPYHGVYITNGDESGGEFLQRILMNNDQYILTDLVNLNNMSEEEELLYGSAESGTLFICTSTYCSSPILTLKDLEEFLN